MTRRCVPLWVEAPGDDLSPSLSRESERKRDRDRAGEKKTTGCMGCLQDSAFGGIAPKSGVASVDAVRTRAECFVSLSIEHYVCMHPYDLGLGPHKVLGAEVLRLLRGSECTFGITREVGM